MNWSNLALALSFLICGATLCPAPEKTPSLYRRTISSSVEVLVNGRIAGTGAVVDANGTVLTACHVIRTGERYEARSSTAKRTPMELIATDRSHDIALLRLPKREKPYPFLPFAKTIPAEGRPAHLLGTPIFRHRLLLTGFVARREPLFEWYDGCFMEGYSLTGVVAGGTSGAAWVNGKGEIIGVQVAAMTVGEAPKGVVTSAPLKAIRSLCENRKTVVAPTMQAAVEELWAQGPEFIDNAPANAKGLVFRQVDAKGVAGEAGIRNGDLLLKMGKQSYETVTGFMRALRRRKPGDKIRLSVSSARGQARREVVFPLAELK